MRSARGHRLRACGGRSQARRRVNSERAQTEHGEHSQEGQRSHRSRAFCHPGSPQHQRTGRGESQPRQRRRRAAEPAARHAGFFSHRRSSPAPTRDRAVFEPIEEPRNPRRAANDDRASIGQMLQEVQRAALPQHLHAVRDLLRRLAARLRHPHRRVLAVAASRDGAGQRRAGARRPRRACSLPRCCCSSSRQPRRARPGTCT